MNKTAIKNFAIWARNKLRADIILKAGLLGITEKGIADPLPQSTGDLQIFDIGTNQPVQVKGAVAIEQRRSLVAAIRAKNLKHAEAFDAVIEEVAYTWFNRLIAVRFMEVNDYLPSRVRVLSSENPAKAEPDFVTNPFDTDLEFTPAELDLIDDLKDHNKSDELFQFLFIKQCNKLNEILPELFEKTNDYTELLLNLSFTDKDGVVWHLVHDIDEDDFNIEKEGQVEIIGWLYQYYNTEPKDKVFGRPSGQKIRKEDIPAATQLFTPDWIVRYMVENSLGRIAIHNLKYGDWNDTERAKIDTFKSKWKYYLEEAEQSQEIIERFRMEESNKYNRDDVPPYVDSTFLDPCMGSGHILVYAFDVFMDIYRVQGYTERDAAQRIIEKNLYGLELDDRATQLAYFAVMMKARSYDRRFLTRGIRPNLCSIQESNSLNTDYLELFGDLKPTALKLVDEFIDAKEYGSILNLSITADEIAQLESKYAEIDETVYDNIFDTIRQVGIRTIFAPLIKQAKIMVKKYEVVCTNPPYMGASGMSRKLNDYVKTYYSESKQDLFAVFIEKCIAYTSKDYYTAMITMHSWMFLSSFEKLRNKLFEYSIINLLHLGARAFDEISGEVVQTTSFILSNQHLIDYQGLYIRLVKGRSEKAKEELFFSKKQRYNVSNSHFLNIPSKRIVYWIGNYDLWTHERISAKFISGGRNKTHNNAKYVREWWEIEPSDKWILYMNGGNYRKWYGNLVEVVNWSETAKQEYASHGGLVDSNNVSSYGISWNGICGESFGFRIKPENIPFSSSSPTIVNSSNIPPLKTLAFLNTSVCKALLTALNPTLQLNVGEVLDTPIEMPNNELYIEDISKNCVEIGKQDWDAFETSWDFKEHPFVRWSKELWDESSIGANMHHFYRGKQVDVNSPLELCFMLWQGESNTRFENLKRNEEELNRVFIDVYGLQNELDSEVDDKDITVRKGNLQRDMRSFISYAVGCMFGRYSLDTEGLVYAGGDWDSEKYKSFIPDDDNCIPITDTAYFEDDIVGRFCEFVKVVFGEDTLEANLEFVAKALGNKGNTCRDIIRNYFLNDFFKDHCKIYQKRPIYWLFDSGKQNGFKALVYMHRWNADTIGNMRVEYLHRIQRTYEKEIEREQDTIDNTTNNRDRTAALKRKEKLQKQLKETKDYDAKVAHLALSRPNIDLDDGVKVNYEKVQTEPDGKKLQILAKI